MFTFSFSQENVKPIVFEFYFNTAQYKLDSIEQAKANFLLTLIDDYNLSKIEVYGFTDSEGSRKTNRLLSQKRVNTIVEFFEKNGYDSLQRMEARGEKNPIYNNDSDEKFKNRRVEVIVYYTSRKIKKVIDSVVVTKKQKAKPIVRSFGKRNKLKLEDFKKGEVITLQSIQFVGGTANFLPGSEKILDEIIPILNESSSIKIEVGGHICCGNNMELSKERAYVVYDYLIQNGVNKEMLVYKGYNNTQPKYGNIMNVKNRRVELKVL